jgi:hypothetical protein
MPSFDTIPTEEEKDAIRERYRNETTANLARMLNDLESRSLRLIPGEGEYHRFRLINCRAELRRRTGLHS